MPSPLQELIAPDSKSMRWIEHEAELTIGPFTFPAAVPVPVATSENKLAHSQWIEVPIEGRAPLSGHAMDDDPEVADLDGEELLIALRDGHLPPHSPDAHRLADQVARCMLIHAAFGSDREFHEEIVNIFSRAEKGPEFYDLLVTRARSRVQDGVWHTEQKDGDAALQEYLLAVMMLHGAHIISPATPGILYDLGVIYHELAHRLSFTNEQEAKFWIDGLSRESRHMLQLAMADEEIRESTPAFYLLGINREVLGEIEEARAAYERFLTTKAAVAYPHLREEVEHRMSDLDSTSEAAPDAGSR